MINNNNSKALVVDDEEHIRKYLSLMLKSIGFECVYNADNGAKAIELFNKHQPRLILLDIIMPQTDGLSVLKKLSDENNHSCIIVLSSVDMEKTVQSCIKYGVSNYILKNARQHEIMETIKLTLNKFSQRI